MSILALILNVVDGKQRLDVPAFCHAAGVEQMQINRHQRGLPVVAVDHIGSENPDRGASPDTALREEGEPLVRHHNGRRCQLTGKIVLDYRADSR